MNLLTTMADKIRAQLEKEIAYLETQMDEVCDGCQPGYYVCAPHEKVRTQLAAKRKELKRRTEVRIEQAKRHNAETMERIERMERITNIPYGRDNE